MIQFLLFTAAIVWLVCQFQGKRAARWQAWGMRHRALFRHLLGDLKAVLPPYKRAPQTQKVYTDEDIRRMLDL